MIEFFERMFCLFPNKTIRWPLQLTVSQLCVTPVRMGAPSLRDTWFTHYAWQIINCVDCFQHLGWLYSLEPSQRPADFRTGEKQCEKCLLLVVRLKFSVLAFVCCFFL